MAFVVENPDRNLSPFTGMTRTHWVDSARFLLEGVFGHVKGSDDPIVMPKQHEITYPQPTDPTWKFQAAEFEGLARTLLLAAPVMADDPEVSAGGLKLRDYYAGQLRMATDPDSPRFWGRITDFQKEFGKIQYQHTVEGAGLVIGLMLSKDTLWGSLDPATRDQVAALLSDYAHARSIGHNWRFFNVLMLTFLKLQGYPIDEDALTDHLQHLLSFHVGDGWYRDDVTYDFYNPWGFHFYGPLWCAWYGAEHEPEIADIIARRNREFMRTYLRMYGRDGHQIMWGRSLIYRFAASAALGACFLLRDSEVDPGWARRVASGNLLQFLPREDLYVNGLPCLGWYGPFAPLVQFYSCAASPFWLAKAYAALALPADHPFWTATENEGVWADLGGRSAGVCLVGPGLHIVNHGSTGTTEVLTAKVPKHDPFYNQLAFNSAFTWESEAPEGANAMNYSVREAGTDEPFRIPLDIRFVRREGEALYRQMDTKPSGLGDPNKGGINKGPEKIDLADITLPGGMLRVDRVRIPYAYDLDLGHYALPHLDGNPPAISRVPAADGAEAWVGRIPGRQVALTALHGWEETAAVAHRGANPEADESTVLCARLRRTQDYGGIVVLITVMLHRLDDGAWTPEELNPVNSFRILPWTATGHPCGVHLRLRDGREFEIDYGDLEGRLI